MFLVVGGHTSILGRDRLGVGPNGNSRLNDPIDAAILLRITPILINIALLDCPD